MGVFEENQQETSSFRSFISLNITSNFAIYELLRSTITLKLLQRLLARHLHSFTFNFFQLGVVAERFH